VGSNPTLSASGNVPLHWSAKPPSGVLLKSKTLSREPPRAGEPVAKLVRADRSKRRRKLGEYAGKIWIAADFDAPVDPESCEFRRATTILCSTSSNINQ
jgi:hypothetical protein